MKVLLEKFFGAEDNSLDLLVINNASKETRGGSGNATEFGRPQGKK